MIILNFFYLARIALSLLALFPVFVIAQQKEILLWPNNPIAKSEKVRVTDQGDHVISNIHNPSITPYIPVKAKSTGVAIIVAPGGGHRELWIDHEGYGVAKWLSDRGIVAFVLKYRLARDSNSTYSIDKEELADIQRSIRIVRSRAKDWNIDTSKIGVMGFSAGGELAALAAMRFDYGNRGSEDPIDKESSRPSFQALIYPGNVGRFEVVQNAPPIFLLGGYKDRDDISRGIAEVYLKYKKANVPAELHIYSSAGHGFGIRKTNKGAIAEWIERFEEWLAEINMTKIEGEKVN